MTPRSIYLVLSVAGTILPYSQFVLFLREHGFDSAAFVQQLFATPISRCFGLDVLLSAVVLATFVRIESRRYAARHQWVVVAALLTVGVSLALPLFLYMREVQAKTTRARTGTVTTPSR